MTPEQEISQFYDTNVYFEILSVKVSADTKRKACDFYFWDRSKVFDSVQGSFFIRRTLLVVQTSNKFIRDLDF